jgi:hypothetical protein
LKVLDKGYNFALDLTSVEGYHKMLWASKVTKVPISRIARIPTWESWDKMSFGCKPMAKHIEYYKGEGGGFSHKFELW